MSLSYAVEPMEQYLAVSESIDWKTPAVLQQAKRLASGTNDPFSISQACFEFVRDEIKHSWDYQQNPVTYKASEVLLHQTGYCYAKSHLLAALLRANGLAAGLCYQRLTISDDQPPFCLHGLNAVYLPEIGWYRIDARGNKEGVDAQFTPPIEQLAFPVITPGEVDFKEILSEPLPQITELLSRSLSYQELADNLPDMETIQSLSSTYLQQV